MASQTDNSTLPSPEMPPEMPPESPAEVPAAGGRTQDLAEIIAAYNAVTERLQNSHERLQGEVLRLRRELASTNAQLQRSKRLSALGEMAAGIAHEIRNPLAAIQLYAGMVIDDLEPESQRVDAAADNTRKIASAVRGLNAIVMDVLSFAREITPRPAQIETGDLFARVLEAHRPAVEAAEVTVKALAADGYGPVALEADGELLHQAMLNLVRNAVDAMVDGADRVLTLAARRDEAGVVLSVRDTGPGIVEKDIDRIFNPFFTTRNTGTGLGLAIVHRIVDAHGGAIAVHNDSAAGGAVFELTLPARAVAVRTADVASGASGAAGEQLETVAMQATGGAA